MDKILEQWFAQRGSDLTAASKAIWEHPEFSEEEHFAAGFLADLLEAEGFRVERGIAGLPTAFQATWGQGGPRIGYLAEYDALPGLSQAATPHRQPLENTPAGHGCGHNLLGMGALGGGLALRHRLEAERLPGTVVIYGCPSEEIMLGKISMAEAGVFDALDVALAWHPGDQNCASEMSYQAMLSMDFSFTGRASHAAMDPQAGRSALDAVELMNVGANYLREHLPRGGQLHYVITGGGDKPNIVPENASVWYFLRARTTADVLEMAERLWDVARGAGLMTGTRAAASVRTGCNETRILPAMAELIHRCMEEAGPPRWSEADRTFAARLADNMGTGTTGARLHDELRPLRGRTVHILGSTDVNDVSWIVPTGMLFTACYPRKTPNHSWGVTACSGMEIGEKGMLYAARALALTGLRLATDATCLQAVQESFRQVMGDERYRPVHRRVELEEG